MMTCLTSGTRRLSCTISILNTDLPRGAQKSTFSAQISKKVINSSAFLMAIFTLMQLLYQLKKSLAFLLLTLLAKSKYKRPFLETVASQCPIHFTSPMYKDPLLFLSTHLAVLFKVTHKLRSLVRISRIWALIWLSVFSTTLTS